MVFTSKINEVVILAFMPLNRLIVATLGHSNLL